jgi:hypothetical protein
MMLLPKRIKKLCSEYHRLFVSPRNKTPFSKSAYEMKTSLPISCILY